MRSASNLEKEGADRVTEIVKLKRRILARERESKSINAIGFLFFSLGNNKVTSARHTNKPCIYIDRLCLCDSITNGWILNKLPRSTGNFLRKISKRFKFSQNGSPDNAEGSRDKNSKILTQIKKGEEEEEFFFCLPLSESSVTTLLTFGWLVSIYIILRFICLPLSSACVLIFALLSAHRFK